MAGNLETSIATTTQWFAVYTRAKAEKKVAERLTLAGFEAFLPLQVVEKQWSDRKKKVAVPLINSYVFVKTTAKELMHVYPVPGVLTILKHLGKYAIVKNSEIDNLRILTKNSCDLTTSVKGRSYYLKGTAVTITVGPFKGLYGNYVTCAGKHKVIIEIESLGSYVAVTLPLNSIEKVVSKTF